jgi:hypothetical protein
MFAGSFIFALALCHASIDMTNDVGCKGCERLVTVKPHLSINGSKCQKERSRLS